MNGPIRALHVIDSLAPGGAERMLVELVNFSSEHNVLPSVCVTRDNLTLANQIHPHISIFSLHRKQALDWRGIKLFVQQVKQNAYDILHVHGYGSLRFVMASCRLFGLPTPIVFHIHNSQPPDLFTQFAGTLGVSHLVATSAETAEWAYTYFGLQPQKISLIGNSIDPTPYENAIPLDLVEWFSTRPKWVGCVVANVLPVKDYETLFRALAASRHRDKIGLLIIGSISDLKYVKYCRQLLNDLKLAEQVFLVGSRIDVPRFLRSVDFAVFSSLHETGPLVLLEYMAAGVPFVSTRVGLVGERLSQTDWAKIVAPRDHQNLALALDNLLEFSSDEWEHRREVGRKFIKSEFNIKANMAKIREIYDLAIKEN